MKGFFVTGIGTDVGKTVVSAVLVQALGADYWKPIQSGSQQLTDGDFIREHCLCNPSIHQEVYSFRDPVSPHWAAELSGQVIDPKLFKPINVNNNIIVEGAGGLMVPLTDNYFIKDLIKVFQLPVIVVSMNYLGSINHTLLTLEALKQFEITVAGLIFNGDPVPSTERVILNHSGVECLGRIPKADILSKGFIAQQADKLRPRLQVLLAAQQDFKSDIPDQSIQLDYDAF